MSNILKRDVRCYLTNAGRAAELNALKNGTKIKIVQMVVDGHLVPDDGDPKSVDTVTTPISVPYNAMVSVDEVSGTLTLIADIPANHGGFIINGIAWILEGEIVYAYSRAMSDVKPSPDSGQASAVRYECEIVTTNASSITHTYDASRLYATHTDLQRSLDEYIKKISITHSYSGDSESDVLSQKGANNLNEALTQYSDTKDAELRIYADNKHNYQQGFIEQKAQEGREHTDQKHNEQQDYINSKFTELMGGVVPATLDTIKEIADAIKANQSLYDALTSAIGLKLDKAGKAADSSLLNGKTLSEVIAMAREGLSGNTWRSISDSIDTTSSSISASLTAVKKAYSKASSAYSLAIEQKNIRDCFISGQMSLDPQDLQVGALLVANLTKQCIGSENKFEFQTKKVKVKVAGTYEISMQHLIRLLPLGEPSGFYFQCSMSTNNGATWEVLSWSYSLGDKNSNYADQYADLSKTFISEIPQNALIRFDFRTTRSGANVSFHNEKHTAWHIKRIK